MCPGVSMAVMIARQLSSAHKPFLGGSLRIELSRWRAGRKHGILGLLPLHGRVPRARDLLKRP